MLDASCPYANRWSLYSAVEHLCPLHCTVEYVCAMSLALHCTCNDIVISSISRQSVGRHDSDGGQTSRKRQLLTFVMTVLSKERELLSLVIVLSIPSSQCIHTSALFGRFPHPFSPDLHPVTRIHDIMCSLDPSQPPSSGMFKRNILCRSLS